MTPPRPDFGLDDLRWLHRLARRLVADPNDADDAVQDTLVAALADGPRARSLRAWLAAVLRNVVLQRRRAEARRAARERSSLAPPQPRAPDDVAAELAWHRALVERVHALREPYRRTIVERFLRERSPREIARDEGVPAKTVHTRIERGLALLRESLDREHGMRGIWVVALLPLARRGRGALGLSLGAALVSIHAKLAAAAVAALALLVGLPLVLRDDGASPPTDASRERRPDSALAAPASDTSAGSGGERVAEPAPAPALAPAVASTPPAAPPAPWTLRGAVRALDGTAVADVEVAYERASGDVAFARPAGAATARSDATGSFTLALAADVDGPGRLTVDDPFWAPVGRPYVGERGDPSNDRALVVAVAPKRTWDGRVVDVSGAPIAGAVVAIGLAGALHLHALDLGDAVVHVSSSIAETRTDEAGAFRFDGVGHVEGATIEASRAGFESSSIALPREPAFDLVLVLAASDLAGRVLHGRVLDAAGVPVFDAHVSLGERSASTDSDGRFALPLGSRFERGVLRAAKRGAGGSAMPYAWAELEPGARRERPLVLVLPSEPPSIRGIVVDAAGKLAAGALVWTPDTTHFGDVDFEHGGRWITGVGTLEGVVGGQSGPWERSVEAMADEQGRFELRGLLPREYEVFALDPETLAFAGPVRAHPERAPARLVLAPASGRPIAGRVVSRTGEPLAGVRVGVVRRFDWTRPERAIDPWQGSPLVPPDAVRRLDGRATTDAEGRFALNAVPVAGTSLTFDGPGLFLAQPVRLDEAGEPAALEVVLDARSTFRLELAAPDEADAFRLETPDGSVQPLFVRFEASTLSAASLPLVAGRSGVAYTRAGEHVVVLERDGEEVRRVHATLPAGGVHAIGL